MLIINSILALMCVLPAVRIFIAIHRNQYLSLEYGFVLVSAMLMSAVTMVLIN